MNTCIAAAAALDYILAAPAVAFAAYKFAAYKKEHFSIPATEKPKAAASQYG